MLFILYIRTPDMQKLRQIFFLANGYTYRGGNSFIFIDSLFNGGQLLNERKCSPMSKLFLLTEDPIFEGHPCHRV